jgi:transcriptional regulator with XRE-family HTH domain
MSKKRSPYNVSDVQAAKKQLAAEKASLNAAALVSGMREARYLSLMQLANQLGMSSLRHLSDIESARVWKTKAGEWQYPKVSLQLLYEIAEATGHTLRVEFVPKLKRKSDAI